MKLHIRAIVCACSMVTLIGCGDPETNDKRGYTKAPLEHPTVAIRAEQPSEMSKLGDPNRVVAEELSLPEEPEKAPEPAKPAANVPLPTGVTQEMVTQGQQLFGTSTCFSCHGANAVGGPLAPALNDPQWLHIDGSYDAIVGIINAGVPTPKQFPAAMPAKGGAAIDDAQVRQLAAYIFSISRGSSAH